MVAEVKIETEEADKIIKYMPSEPLDPADMVQAKFISLKKIDNHNSQPLPDFGPKEINLKSALEHLHEMNVNDGAAPPTSGRELRTRQDELAAFRSYFPAVRKPRVKRVNQSETSLRDHFKEIPDLFKESEMSNAKKARYKKRMQKILEKPQAAEEILKMTEHYLQPF